MYGFKMISSVRSSFLLYKSFPRLLSTVQQLQYSTQSTIFVDKYLKNNEELLRFEDVFQSTMGKLSNEEGYSKHPLVLKRLDEMVKHTSQKGRGLVPFLFLHTYKQLKSCYGLPYVSEESVYTMASLLQFYLVYMLVIDDIEDESCERRGMPCWYNIQKNKYVAINDGFLLLITVLRALKTFFGHTPYYQKCLDVILYHSYEACVGQMLDLLSRNDVLSFNMELYEKMATYKTSFSIYVPIIVATHMAGISSSDDQLKYTQQMIDKVGYAVQVRDDLNDSYVDGKVFTGSESDIYNGACTWIICRALQDASESQKEVLVRCYGTNNLEDAEEVGHVFDELHVKEKCEQEIEKLLEDITKGLQYVENLAIRNTFAFIGSLLYKNIARS